MSAAPQAFPPTPTRPQGVVRPESFVNVSVLKQAGLTAQMIADGVTWAYWVLDTLDDALIAKSEHRLAMLVEQANLSSMVGNLLRAGITRASRGVFAPSGPHKYQDLRHRSDPAKNVEIKMAGEGRSAKGHLPKAGFHLTARYVLCDAHGTFWRGKSNHDRRKNEGVILYIWELRFGNLTADHYRVSNTPGDSGKTANAKMSQLVPIYFDSERCPLSPKHNAFKVIQAACASGHGS
jgi:hypothetical protein